MAAAALFRGGRGDAVARRFADEPGAATIAQMLARSIRSPLTTSAGRWFDAAAGLLGVSRRMAYEGQAAMLLEGLAEAHGPAAPLRDGWTVDDEGVLDLTGVLMHLADEPDAARGASVFHATLVAALAAWIGRAAEATGLRVVACGGGCFLNAVLATGLRAALAARGIAMLEANAVPPNDGGLSLGQAAIARRLAS